MHQALGPRAFGKKMLTGLIGQVDAATIIATEPNYEVYDQRSQQTALARRNVSIIETRPEREPERLTRLRSDAPKIPITSCAVKP